MSKFSEVSELLNKINAIESLVRVNDLEVQGQLPSGNEVTVKVTNWKFDSGVHGVPVNFTVVVRVDGAVASRWDFCFNQDQKEFQIGWVRLIARLQSEEFKREDEVRDKAKALWNSFK